MTKKEFLTLLESAINGRKHLTIESSGNGSFRLYDSTDTFTSTFISDVIKLAAYYFTGITVDANGRPYMLFNF